MKNIFKLILVLVCPMAILCMNTSQIILKQVPLITATKNRNVGVVKLLLERKASVHKKNTNGETAFSVALENRDEEIVRLLYCKDTNIDYCLKSLVEKDDLESLLFLGKQNIPVKEWLIKDKEILELCINENKSNVLSYLLGGCPNKSDLGLAALEKKVL